MRKKAQGNPQTSIVLSPFFLEDFHTPILGVGVTKDKYSQEFERFVRYDSDAISSVKRMRRDGKIVPHAMQKRFAVCRSMLERDEKFTPAFNRRWSRIVEDVNSRLRLAEVRLILECCDRPYTWEESLVWYILTDEIKFVANRCQVYLDEDGQQVIMKLSADATWRDAKREWKNVEKWQDYLVGYSLKKKHKTNIEKSWQIARDVDRYQKGKQGRPRHKIDPVTERRVVAEDMARFRLLEKHAPGAFDDPIERRKALNRLRKTKQRHKRYVTVTAHS